MAAVDVDAEFLIAHVQARPVLWDKYYKTYKDRNATKSAWNEVCVELHPDFDALDDNEKNVFGKDVVRRWTNFRDSFLKSMKKQKDSKKSGSPAKKHKKYVYFDELRFLEKVYDAQETLDYLEPDNDEENKEEENMELKLEITPDILDVSTPLVKGATRSLRARKHKKSDKVELKTLEAPEGNKPCSKMAFFQSLMPHLQKFDDQNFLKFQIGVLKLIENINENK